MKTALITLLGMLTLASLTISPATPSNENTGTIKGTVVDKPNRDPIAYANLILENNQKKMTTTTDQKGAFRFQNVPEGQYKLTARFLGYESEVTKNIVIQEGATKKITIKMRPSTQELKESKVLDKAADNALPTRSKTKSRQTNARYMVSEQARVRHNTESYSPIEENGYKSAKTSPLSTFAADVDAASYSNMRRFLMNGNMPQKDAVRIEEMINYFDYDYPNPDGEHPFSINTEIGDCPWNLDHKLVHVGLQGQRIETKNLPPNNLVFLLDVSGSMSSPNKLGLLKKSLKMLVNELGEKDRIAIVVYAGAAGEVLPSTAASNKTKILDALEELNAGGSTAGGEGIELAYQVAQENFIEGGNNRVILATDGDFNVGVSSDGAMKDLIEEKRETGVFLTCLGFGMGNYKDSKMEVLANKGNGNYSYIDNILEAKKVLVNEIGATLVTIAKDVKIQVEFNPSVVSSYRLVGYENRLLDAEDFNDDKKDAGEIGAGHSVTALYEVVLKGSDDPEVNVDELRYQERNNKDIAGEILTVKFRYKEPEENTSKLITKNLSYDPKDEEQLSDNFKWSAAVASFGMLLRESEYKENANIAKVKSWAQSSKGSDKNGYRSEFIRLVDLSESLME